jgi:protein-disulfide isomerase
MTKRLFCIMTKWIPLALLIFSSPAPAFMKDGCGAGECKDCHEMSKKDAAQLLSVTEEFITEVKFAEIPGLWEVDIRQQEKVIPVFVDFSKQYLISGSIIKIADREDITRKRFVDLNRVDILQIPQDDALVVGNPSAKNKIIVFDDPESLDPPACETDVIDKNIKLAEQMGINSTPTLIFPDGRVIPGYIPSEEIVRLLENQGP